MYIFPMIIRNLIHFEQKEFLINFKLKRQMATESLSLHFGKMFDDDKQRCFVFNKCDDFLVFPLHLNLNTIAKVGCETINKEDISSYSL